MTALREEAYRILDDMPEEAMMDVVLYMTDYQQRREAKLERLARKKSALDEILSLSKPVPGLNAEKELERAREERLGYANPD